MKVVLSVPTPNQGFLADNTLTSVVPPLGLCQVAACLADQGHDVVLMDPSAERLDENLFVKRVLAADADALMLTSTTPQIRTVGRIAAAVKREAPLIRAVVGGPHPSALPRRTLEEFPALDAVVFGEGDFSAGELLEYFQKPKGVKPPAGTMVRIDSTIEEGAARPWIDDLDRLPFPIFNGLPLDSYGRFFSRMRLRKVPVHTGRGCPFRCAFCYRGMGGAVRQRSVESVVEEVARDIKELGAEQIIFTDENLAVPSKRILSLCEELIKRSLNVSWICETHATSLNVEVAKAMKAAGCEQVHIGVESGDQEILRRSGKNVTLEKVRASVHAARQAKLFIQANFIFGHPNETEQTAQSTVDFAATLGADRCGFAIMVPFPGTDVYEMAKKGEGGLRLLTENWDKYGKQFGYALELEKLPRYKLVRYQLKGYVRTLGRMTELVATGFFPDFRTLLNFAMVNIEALAEAVRYKLFGPKKAVTE